MTEQLSILEEFAERAAAARRKKLFDIEETVQRIDDRQRQEKHERKEREALEAAWLATPAELTAFHERLDRYHTATVAALMDNEAAQAESRARLQHMLSQATVLPDGRRAFRSEDGQRVMDEHGAAVSPDLVHPGMIQSETTWETYAAECAHHDQLDRERVQLLEYQARVDQAKTEIGDRPPAKDELEGLDADLKQAMPDAVRRHLAGDAPDPSAHAATPATLDKPAIQPGVRISNPAL